MQLCCDVAGLQSKLNWIGVNDIGIVIIGVYAALPALVKAERIK